VRVVALRRERDDRWQSYEQALAELHKVITPEVVMEIVAEADVRERVISELETQVQQLRNEVRR
jgi:hypothetical protein